jgi:hypothetical protein
VLSQKVHVSTYIHSARWKVVLSLMQYIFDKAMRRVDEVQANQRPLQYHSYDPYTDQTLLDYVRGNFDPQLLVGLSGRQVLSNGGKLLCNSNIWIT